MFRKLFGSMFDKHRLLLGVVVAPTLLATTYFAFLASDIYVSEARFVVRSPDKPAQSQLGILLKGVGFSNAGDEIFAVRDFVSSRDALIQVNKDGLVEKAYRDPKAGIFDRFDPLGFSGTGEDLFEFYRDHTAIAYDSTSSILTLEVRSFDPSSAQAINRRLLEASEQLVNRLNRRGQDDLIRYASTEVDEARVLAREAAVRLAEFRNRAGVVDPSEQAKVQLQMIAKIQDDLIASRNQLRQLEAFTPRNPQIPMLRVRVRGLEAEIGQSLSSLTGGQKSLAKSAVEYQRLLMDSQFADRQLVAAMASLNDARNEARRKQAYVERIVEPNLPDDSREPRRLWGILSILALSLVAWLVLRLLIAGVREHQD